MDQNINVYVRCRPLKPQEKKSAIEVIPEFNRVKVSEARVYSFDGVFDHNSDQRSVYRSVVKPLIEQVMLGYNCTVFAYGQTGTGKTHTMEGDGSNDDHSGIIPRAINQLFDSLNNPDSEFSVRVSFLELYNEDAYDLLSPIEDTTKLRIFDAAQKKGTVIVDGLGEVDVQSKSQIYDILRRGSAKRQTAATLLNACSSRSHTIFTVTVQVKERSVDGDETLRIGKLNLVDLAGSENIARSGLQNKQAREAANINQSLLTLTRVITALVEKRSHIPFRESKLTRILQDSIGGSTKTSMIATISPAEDDNTNTLGTIEYASRARSITNKPDRQNLQRKPSDIDLDAFKNELEIQIRNEVALEFRRETDKIREQYSKVLNEKNELLCKSNQDADELRDKAQDMAREIEDLRAKIDKMIQDKDAMAIRLDNSERLTHTQQEEIINLKIDIRRVIDEKQAELESLRESCTCKDHETQIEKKANKAKKASRIRKQVLDQDHVNDYANMTFDGDDEIIQVSTKKARREITAGGKKQTLHRELTMSGKKKKLRGSDDDVSISSISPAARVTRSRATRRKLY